MAEPLPHVLYNCAASRPSIESQTNEDEVEVQTETLSLTATPLANGYVKAKTGDETTDSVYSAWYDAVYLPSAEAAAASTTSTSTASSSSAKSTSTTSTSDSTSK